MRSIAAAVLAVPIAGLELIARYMSRRTLPVQMAITSFMILALVAGLLLTLPTKDIEARAPTPYDPAAPAAKADSVAGRLPVDSPFVLRFSKPMNQGSVTEALTIKPATNVRLVWDSTGETLSLTPTTYWAPFASYSITVAGTAMDQSGMSLGTPAVATFATGELTSGKITATSVVAGLVSPSSSFVITFTKPVKLATIQARLSISPPVTGTITGDDPTDVGSQVFTFTPYDGLDGGTNYTINFNSTNATDAEGVTLLPVDPLTITTMEAPSVVVFRPRDGALTGDPNQVISVRFTVPMDRRSTNAAFSVYSNGKHIRGAVSWAEGDSVLIFDPNASFTRGSTVIVKVTNTARSKAGQRTGKTTTASFKVVKPSSRVVPKFRLSPTRSAPWHGSEVYMMALLNCTRTGGWVTSSGACSSVTHHVMPAQDALYLDAGISEKVSRPYAKILAEKGLLTHYLYGSTPKTRLAAAGYSGRAWGENLTRPSSSGGSGMIQSEIFFQNEYRCARGGCEFGHYYNVMYGGYRRAGIGVWVAGGGVRVCIDFYG
jgi:hypothetical protein